MGVWGAGLYANDCGGDVRDSYVKLLQEQWSNEEAYEKIMETFQEYIGDEEEPLLWYALADTQWKLGRLMPEVKEKALGWIEKSGGLSLWEESKNRGKGWKKTMEKLKTRLESPMPPEKKIRKPEEFIRNPWNIGDIYAYQFHSEKSEQMGLLGKYIPFQKLGDVEWCDGWILSRIQIYDRVFDQVPSLADLDGVRILPIDRPDRFLPKGTDDDFPLTMNAIMIRYYKRDFPEKYFTFVGNQPDTAKMPLVHPNLCNYFWRDLEEDWLCEYCQIWREYAYEIRDGKSYVRLK